MATSTIKKVFKDNKEAMNNIKENAPEWATHYRLSRETVVYESLYSFERYDNGIGHGKYNKIIAVISRDAKEL